MQSLANHSTINGRQEDMGSTECPLFRLLNQDSDPERIVEPLGHIYK